jgi:PAS domain S-box-containing protein
MAILGEIVHVQREYVRSGDPQRMWDELLRSLMRTTRSDYGFIAEVVWSERGMPDLNTRSMVWAGDPERSVSPHPDVGLLVSQVIAEQAPVVLNLAGLGSADMARFGPVDGFLGLPLISSNRLVGIVGLTSPATPYRQEWVESFEPLLSACASIVESLQAANERDLAVRRLERTAVFLQAIINGTSHAVLVVDPDGRVESANPAAGVLLGIPADRLGGRPITDFVPAPDTRRRGLQVGWMLRHGVPDELGPFVARVVDREGRSRSVEASIGDITIDGEPRLVVLAQDISERLQAQAALERAAEVLDATPDLVAWADAGRSLVYLSRGGRTMIGLGADDEIDGLTIEALCADVDRARFVEEVLPCAQSTGIWTGEMTYRTFDGGEVPVSLAVIAKDAYIAVVARDLTERREIDRLKDAFVSNVSHELRTPLTAVIGYLELLFEGALGPLNDDQNEAIEVMRRNGDRLLELIGDILLIGSFEAGGGFVERPVDLAALVASVVEELQPVGIRSDVTVGVSAGDVGVVAGDAVELRKVVTNIVGNAIKFTPRGGRVDVACRRHPEGVVVSVEDTGIGIAADELPKVFDRFYRGAQARSSEIQGAGLGLAIVKSVVERHGGRLDVRSRFGSGTTVEVVLPQEGGET